MTEVLTSIAAFIVAIGVMVTVHEYGHYWVARRCGVRVLRFSVGFGRALWRRTLGRDGTEWVIAALPLGGYVKMLDEREAEVPAAERHRAFNNQPVGRRAAIVAAGPAVNILLAVVAYTATFLIGVDGLVPRVGDVQAGSPAAEAGFERGERITAVNGTATATWSDVRLSLLDHGLDGAGGSVAVTVERDGGTTATRRLDIGSVSLREGETDPVTTLGFERWSPELPARVTDVVPDSPAAAAGLRPGDRVLRAGDTRIRDWAHWVEYVRARPGERFEVTVLRDGAETTVALTPAAEQAGGREFGRIGAYGPGLTEADRERMFTTVRYGPLQALGQGVVKTWDITRLTVRVLVGLVTGEAALSNISGPISIAQYAGQSAQIGLSTFIGFVALISVSIGILNLLPIPVLDGGHLLYYAIEAVKGSPVSERAQAFGQQIGIAMLVGLMSLALYNDVVRLVQ
ncbi:MAG: sigma E protease regulator RseP [Halofilum sp. (in: g-proteobacteria)]|nr:sigma E protease regulator RseP [Halofilum sp. (in: g-proteobacteria)]